MIDDEIQQFMETVVERLEEMGTMNGRIPCPHCRGVGTVPVEVEMAKLREVCNG